MDDPCRESRVSVEHTLIPFQGGKEFDAGSLNLYSITPLKAEGQILHYDTASPTKKSHTSLVIELTRCSSLYVYAYQLNCSVTYSFTM